MGDISTTNRWLSEAGTSAGGPLEGVCVSEEFGTRKEKFSDTSFEASVTLRCPWLKRWAVLWDIYVQDIPYPDTTFVDATTTEEVRTCFITSYSIAPAPGKQVAAPEQVITYQEALITITYSTDEAQAKGLYIQSIEPVLQNMVLDHAAYYRGKDGSPTDEFRKLFPREAPAKLHVMWNYTVKWLQQQQVPIEYAKLAGGVNKEEYIIKNIFGLPATPGGELKCPPESMLYQPSGMEKSVWMEWGDSMVPTAEANKVPQAGWDYTLKFSINMVEEETSPADPDADPPTDAVIVNRGIWNLPYQADATHADPDDPKEFENWQPIFKSKKQVEGDPFVPAVGKFNIYIPKSFPVYDSSAAGIRFLPPSS